MAYAERVPNRNKTLAVISVAGLHGMALYGLVTGLGVEYVEQAVTVIKGYNEPIDPPPPPPSEAAPIEQAAPSDSAQPRASTMIDIGPNPFAQRDPVDLVPMPPIDRITLDPPGPMASPTPEKPAYMSQSLKPRNDPGSWVSTDDYPSASLLREEQGTVRFELAVTADGRVSDCRVTASSGSATLDGATCQHVARRARFEPAKDNTGARVSGTYAGSIRWVIPRD